MCQSCLPLWFGRAPLWITQTELEDNKPLYTRKPLQILFVDSNPHPLSPRKILRRINLDRPFSECKRCHLYNLEAKP